MSAMKKMRHVPLSSDSNENLKLGLENVQSRPSVSFSEKHYAIAVESYRNDYFPMLADIGRIPVADLEWLCCCIGIDEFSRLCDQQVITKVLTWPKSGKHFMYRCSTAQPERKDTESNGSCQPLSYPQIMRISDVLFQTREKFGKLVMRKIGKMTERGECTDHGELDPKDWKSLEDYVMTCVGKGLSKDGGSFHNITEDSEYKDLRRLALEYQEADGKEDKRAVKDELQKGFKANKSWLKALTGFKWQPDHKPSISKQKQCCDWINQFHDVEQQQFVDSFILAYNNGKNALLNSEEN